MLLYGNRSRASLFYSPLHFQQQLNLFSFVDFPQKLFQMQYENMNKIQTLREKWLLSSGEKHPNLVIPRPNSLVVDMGPPKKQQADLTSNELSLNITDILKVD